MTLQYTLLLTVMLCAILGTPSPTTSVFDRGIMSGAHSFADVSSRDATDSCADPTLARTMSQWFSGSQIAHDIEFRAALVNDNSILPAGPPVWNFQGPVCKAWATQQPFTVPLFRLTTPQHDDLLFMIGTPAQTPPVVSGWRNTGLIAWVYDSPVCGSVPLLSAVLASQSDHYYTTDPDEHATLLNLGWTDGGLVAYVLPLPSL